MKNWKQEYPDARIIKICDFPPHNSIKEVVVRLYPHWSVLIYVRLTAAHWVRSSKPGESLPIGGSEFLEDIYQKTMGTCRRDEQQEKEYQAWAKENNA